MRATDHARPASLSRPVSSLRSTPPASHGQVSVQAPDDVRKVVLVGNPNVGKSLFFNAFTGLYVDVSNFPGTTVAVSSGRMGDDVVLDTPGIYGVSSFNDEEIVARDIVIDADVVLNVVDAVHLERDLFLTLQLIDMGLPLVVALNMVDEAAARGMRVDDVELVATVGGTRGAYGCHQSQWIPRSPDRVGGAPGGPVRPGAAGPHRGAARPGGYARRGPAGAGR